MCGGPEQSNTNPGATFQDEGLPTSYGVASSSRASKTETVDAEASDPMSYLLELAANNDLEGFQQALKEDKAKVDGVGSWYGRQNGTALMVLEKRTPAMIAALYGSVDVLKYILNLYDSIGNINMKCGNDGSTALHCAAAGGSACAVETVNLLLDFGADLNVLDVQGRRPADVIASFPRLKHVKTALESALKAAKSVRVTQLEVSDGPESGMSPFVEDGEDGFIGLDAVVDGGVLSIAMSSSSSSSLGASGQSPLSSPSPSSSPKALDTPAVKAFGEGNEKAKEYLIDSSIPDIKNSIYTTDEFRMFSFKIRPCSRAYSHDWTECPFVHPGENARRRDPRRYHYSCVPCPDFRKGACRRGDACEYAHGVFECWLHPAQYRTRLCKDGTGCTRRVCFFAHTSDELRPLHISSGTTIPSPRTSSLDMAAMSPPLGPGSPSSALMMSAFSLSNPAYNPTQVNLATPPMSPSSSPANSLAGAWSPSSMPALHLPGASLHTSRLRSSLNARDISLEDLGRASEFDGQLVSEFTSLSSQALSTQARLNAAVAASACGSTSSRVGKYRSLGLTVAPTNLEEFFVSDMMSSPRSMVHDSPLMSQLETQMKTSQIQSQLQAQIKPQVFSPTADQMQLQLQQAALESQMQCSPRLHSSMQTPSFSLGSLGRMSALGGLELDRQSSCGVSLSPSVVAARAAFAQRDKRSHSSRDLGAGLPLSDWGSPTGKPEWGVQRDDLSKFRKSASFGFRGSEEPDLSWVQTLVKEGPPDADTGATVSSEDGSASGNRDAADHSVLGSWMENLHLDQIVA